MPVTTLRSHSACPESRREPGRYGAASAILRRAADGGEACLTWRESTVRFSPMLRFPLSTHVPQTCAILPITIFRMNTCEKSVRNQRLGMNTYKNTGLKVPLESTLTKKGGGGGHSVSLCPSHEIGCNVAHRHGGFSRSGESAQANAFCRLLSAFCLLPSAACLLPTIFWSAPQFTGSAL